MIQKRLIPGISEWLEWRRPHVTASVVGALFNCHPYVTALSLFMEKSGVEMKPPTSSVLRRGRLLEPVVAAVVAEKHPEWRLEKANEFFSDSDVGIGATPDFWIHGDPRGLGVLQTKTVRPAIFKRDWTETVPPFWIVLQTLTEAMLTGATFGAVAGMIFDETLEVHVHTVDRHAASEQRITKAVLQFWEDVRAGIPPEIDYSRDRALMGMLMPQEAKDTILHFDGDNELMSGLIERADLKRDMKLAQARCEAIETMVMARMGDAAVAMLPGFRATWKTSVTKEYTVAARKGRVLRIYDKRPDREDDAA